MNKTFHGAVMGAALSLLLTSGAGAAEKTTVAASVKASIAAQPSELLAIVERSIAADSGSACEVVKSAIEASKADADTVASIVRVASTTAPDQMRLIGQCSVAAAPDAAAQVQAVLAKLDPAAGESYSAKEAGSYLWAKDVRLGKVVSTSDDKHKKVYDVNGVYLGDLRMRDGSNPGVRATTTEGGFSWVYIPRVPVPGEGWILVEGGILALLNGDNGDFYLQYESSEFNPLNFPGQGVVNPGPPNTNSSGPTPPPGPGPIPPVLTPIPTTNTNFN
jgi:hypothetical protein